MLIDTELSSYMLIQISQKTPRKIEGAFTNWRFFIFMSKWKTGEKKIKNSQNSC